MFKAGKKLLAVLLSVLLVVCALPISTIASTASQITISTNVTNGVVDEKVEFDYMVTINGEPYNGVAEGSDSKDYTANEGKLTLPSNVSATINVNDGDTYSVKRLAYPGGKYSPLRRAS